MPELAHIVPPQGPDAREEQREDATDEQPVEHFAPHHECKASTSVISGMMRAMKSLILLVLLGSVAVAAPKPKKYHFELTKVLVKPEVKAEVGATAQPRVEAAIKKAFATNPQLVATLDGAPDPETDHGQVYRKFLAKKGIDSAYLVTVEITEATEELVPMEDKKNSQRLVVHVGIHVLGETIPGRTMGFTGDGQATVKQEVGVRDGKIRDKDREYGWDQAAELAVADCIKTSLEKLDKGK